MEGEGDGGSIIFQGTFIFIIIYNFLILIFVKLFKNASFNLLFMPSIFICSTEYGFVIFFIPSNLNLLSFINS